MIDQTKQWIAAAAFAAATACIGYCIARGSRVRTPRGLRAIEELVPEDEVLCVDPLSATAVVGKIVATRSARRECVRLSFDHGSLTLTSDHPIYSPESGLYAPAGDWVLGTRRQLLLAGEEGVIRTDVNEVSSFAGLFEVFDLTVDHPLHNFVAEGVLVHNKEPIPRPCHFADGGETYEYAICECPGGGQGHVGCSRWGASCSFCPDVEASDGGTSDGGTGDAGTSDGGSSDGGTSDGG